MPFHVTLNTIRSLPRNCQISITPVISFSSTEAIVLLMKLDVCVRNGAPPANVLTRKPRTKLSNGQAVVLLKAHSLN